VEKNQILIVENFLNQRSIHEYYEYAVSSNLWESNGDGIWDNRSINISTMPEDIRISILEYRIAVKNKILNFFSITSDLYCDIFQFVKWRVGDSLYPPHADAEYINGIPHPFGYRNYSAVTYLNDNYKGGEIYFTEFDNFKPKISPGTLVIFPGTLKYMHGVTEVKEGTRFTIASFFTFDKTKHDGYKI
jgi:predicted 2-oxoglutarate/Fe(II)-dependent dioxygenase YbiX